MIHASLTSLDLHLKFPADAVEETLCLEDSACGIYPSYYQRMSGHLRVASSAAALILKSGSLEPNPDFQPPQYLSGDDARQRFVRGTAALPKSLKDAVKQHLPDAWLRGLAKNRFWYESWETMDARVRKLRPFETATPDGASNRFKPDFTLRDPDELIENVAVHLKRCIREIEESHPEHHHVMLIGGTDSQIIALIPKRRPERWHVFSADPNGPLVREWLNANNVTVGRFYGHFNDNEETEIDTARKIVAGDLYSDPRHQRWLPTLRKIVEDFNSKCIFWSGSAADALHVGRSFHRRYAEGNPRGFFDIHTTRVPCFIGNYHQVVKNFTGCPLLCPYQTSEIWRDVYMHHGPAVIPGEVDLRPSIGECVAGHPIQWLSVNPSPEPYGYAKRFDARAVYLRHLHEARGAYVS